MAKKGQKFKKYPEELKTEILERYFKQYLAPSELSRQYDISENTIENWVYKTKKGKDVLIDHRKGNSGRTKQKISEIDYKERYEILKKYQAFLKAQREKK